MSRKLRDSLLDILLDVQHGRDTVYEAADRIEAMASTPSAEVSTWNAALLAALAVVDPDEAALGPAYVFRVVKNRIRSLLKPTGGETAPARQTEQSLYCELAVSEIPGFGTNRYTHGCAKLHRGNASRAAACSGVYVIDSHGGVDRWSCRSEESAYQCRSDPMLSGRFPLDA
jgi:hypothetical protein